MTGSIFALIPKKYMPKDRGFYYKPTSTQDQDFGRILHKTIITVLLDKNSNLDPHGARIWRNYETWPKILKPVMIRL